MAIARIKLISSSKDAARDVAKQIASIAKGIGIKYKGPIPLPTKHMVIPTRKTPCGDGSDTYDHWEMRIYKRLIDMDADERALRQLMRIRIPENIKIEIELVD